MVSAEESTVTSYCFSVSNASFFYVCFQYFVFIFQQLDDDESGCEILLHLSLGFTDPLQSVRLGLLPNLRSLPPLFLEIFFLRCTLSPLLGLW